MTLVQKPVHGAVVQAHRRGDRARPFAKMMAPQYFCHHLRWLFGGAIADNLLGNRQQVRRTVH